MQKLVSKFFLTLSDISMPVISGSICTSTIKIDMKIKKMLLKIRAKENTIIENNSFFVIQDQRLN